VSRVAHNLIQHLTQGRLWVGWVDKKRRGKEGEEGGAQKECREGVCGACERQQGAEGGRMCACRSERKAGMQPAH
jgi:hypothetical protein